MSLKKIYTLAFLKQENTVLLGYKTRGLGKGLWNGFGGKVEQNETILEAAKREVKEECNLVVTDLKSLGIVHYDDETDEQAVVYVFTGSKFEGHAQCSEEMNPIKWYRFGDVPYDRMWPDTCEWYPFVFNDRFFYARIRYADGKIDRRFVGECESFSRVLEFET